MEWLNKPANYKKVNQISDFLKSTAEKYGLKYKVFNREESIKEGLGAFVAVNQEVRMKLLSPFWNTIVEKKMRKLSGLVGKCVVRHRRNFHKPSANLHYMKAIWAVLVLLLAL
jgi:leucyl aminopeptidase